MIIEDLLSGKTKLEFGNKEQIEAIDNYENAQQEAFEEGLKQYRVIFHYSGSAEICVNAFDEHEAEGLARDEIAYEDIEWEDIEHTEVELLRDSKEEFK